MIDEIHLIIVWKNAADKLDEIIDDLSDSFSIKNVFETIWSDTCFSENLTRFYGQNLPAGCDKESHIGRGSFHAIIFQDSNPRYEIRGTTKGDVEVNVNVFDAKQKYREWTGGGHKIHGTNSPEESLQDIWMLLAQDTSEFLTKKNWDKNIEVIFRDLIGANGWESIEQLFHTLNRTCNYIVMRNFEPLPENYHLEMHGDIDLLVENLTACIHITNGTKAFDGDHRVHYFLKIADEIVPFDFRYTGDSYYDKSFEISLLKNREFINDCFYTPTRVGYFYSLLYHALIHKVHFSSDYAERLTVLANEVNIDFDGTENCASRVLAAFFYKNDYRYVRPVDTTVIYNEQWTRLFNDWLEEGPRLAEIVSQAKDLSTLSVELRRQCVDWISIYHLSALRANILRPFVDLLCGRVLEIGADCGAITRYLGECGGEVVALEASPRRASIAKSRTRDMDNVTVVIKTVEAFKSDQLFDVITLIGGIQDASIFMSGGTPAVSMLKHIKSLLKPDGKLILAMENQLGLKYFAGASEDSTGQSMYGIEGRNKAGQPDVLGKPAIEQLFENSGFTTINFLSPFPDYKTPVSILTENGIEHPDFDAATLASQAVVRDPLLPKDVSFVLELAWPEIFKNKLAMEMSNSFLYIASDSQEEMLDSNILAYHYSTERLAKYCKETKFLKKESENIFVTYQCLADCDKEQQEGEVLFKLPDCVEYAIGHSLSHELVEIVSCVGWTLEEISRFAKRYLSAIESIAKEKGIDFNQDLNSIGLPGEFLDLLPQNIMVKPDGGFEPFDLEWSYSDCLPLDFLMFRGLFVTFGSITSCSQPLDDRLIEWKYLIQQVIESCGIPVSDESYAQFILKEISFREQVMGELSGTLDVLLTYKLPVKYTKVEKDEIVADYVFSKAERDVLIAERDVAIAELSIIKKSKSWRLFSPLRFVKRLKTYGLLVEDGERIKIELRKLFHRLPVPFRKVVKLVYRKLLRRMIKKVIRALNDCTNFRAPELQPKLQQSGFKDYIVWGVIDWHFRHQRPQQLALALASKGHRVFYVSPVLIDEGCSGFKAENLCDSGKVYQINLYVKGAPSIYTSAASNGEAEMLKASMGEMLDWANIKDLVSLVQHPYWFDAAYPMPNSRLVYDCMDHHEGFNNTGESLLQLEKMLLSKVDLTVTTSTWLDNVVSSCTPRRALIRNAGEYEHFSKQPETIYRDPDGRRIIGYYGAIADWFDLRLIEAIARRFSSYTILLVGEDTVNAKSELSGVTNIRFIGEVAYAKLPEYLFSFDVCLLPFKIIPLTMATNPVKAYEYLSAGKPVVSVDLPEMHQFDGLISIASNQSNFLETLEGVLEKTDENNLIQRRKEFAATQTWIQRVENLSEQVENLSSFDPKVSVVVVTYNNIDLTRLCLDSIEQLTDYDNLEVIVVDNNSTDGSQEYITNWASKKSEYIAILNDDNRGFSAANNQGLQVASGDYLVLLNNDTHVTPGWVRTLIGHLKRNENIGLIGPVTNNIGNEAKIDIQYNSMSEMLIKSAEYTRRHIGQVYNLNAAAFFCVMMAREVYEQVGPLDEVFGIGFFEDDDYCRRINQLGLEVVCAEDVFIHHNLSASFDKLKISFRNELFEKNKKIYEEKWGAWIPHEARKD